MKEISNAALDVIRDIESNDNLTCVSMSIMPSGNETIVLYFCNESGLWILTKMIEEVKWVYKNWHEAYRQYTGLLQQNLDEELFT